MQLFLKKNSFTGKLEGDGTGMIFVSEKQQKTYSNLFFRFINCNKII